jgi:hypothetical protein
VNAKRPHGPSPRSFVHRCKGGRAMVENKERSEEEDPQYDIDELNTHIYFDTATSSIQKLDGLKASF